MAGADEKAVEKPELLPVHFEARTYGYPDAEPVEECVNTSGLVGSFVVTKRGIGPVKKALEEAGWLKKPGRFLTPCPGPAAEGIESAVAIHVNHAAAAAMVAGAPPWAQALQAAERNPARWVPGLRAHSEACTGEAFVAGCHPAPVPGEGKEGGAKSRFRFIELFAGIGGFRLGLQPLGGRCVFSSEIDDCARATYAANFKDGEPAGDMTEIDAGDIPDHDLLTAGFPCQAFSKAGGLEGFESYKGNLFFEVTRVIAAKRPRAVLLENVANLIKHEQGRTLATIIHALEGLGYGVRYTTINARALVPQQRERLYIVCFRKDGPAGAAFDWPELPCLPRIVEHILEPEEEIGELYDLTEPRWDKIKRTSFFQENPSSRLAMRQGAARTLMSSYRAAFYRYSEFVPPLGCTEGAGGAAPAVGGEGGEGGEGGRRPRFYTPRECARLMGFPETFVLDAECKGETGRRRGK
eukprot:CAMPEP_0182852302 /NCGR_PEP_ID=MMETSP0034_2-20130328/91_1 /TAXON_ID=156128 /ORGANISM="Nephroselmis pyriformis, Strain CCMP717" /LENGTH=466 /DNA_ID=CAMNT_0024983003 /DNA_START=98 /DNA_END=1495 /DNA_ORIENTATION=+